MTKEIGKLLQDAIEYWRHDASGRVVLDASFAEQILAALRQPAGEPVAWMHPLSGGIVKAALKIPGVTLDDFDIPLYAHPPSPSALAEGIAPIAAERQRQIEVEGWTAAHDDEHAGGEMAQAAACYALRATHQHDQAHDLWPWDDVWWKPKDPRADLVRAGALIAAEIARIDRLSALPPVAGEAEK